MLTAIGILLFLYSPSGHNYSMYIHMYVYIHLQLHLSSYLSVYLPIEFISSSILLIQKNRVHSSFLICTYLLQQWESQQPLSLAYLHICWISLYVTISHCCCHLSVWTLPSFHSRSDTYSRLPLPHPHMDTFLMLLRFQHCMPAQHNHCPQLPTQTFGLNLEGRK